MKIWFIEIGEPLPIEKNVRLHRYGMLTRELAKYGHEIVWWTSSFSHAPKKHFSHENVDIEINGITLRVIKGLGYKKNVSFRRINHQRHFARNLERLHIKYELPELIVCPIPTIEAAKVAVSIGGENNIPVIIDIRDEWPDELVNLFPSYLRFLARFILRQYFHDMKMVCHNAVGITASSQRQLKYGLSFSGRKTNSRDGVFPHGYTSMDVAPERLRDAHMWWAKQGIDKDAFICCFFGTIGRFFNLDVVIEAAKVLSNEIRIQFVLCGDGSKLEYYKNKAQGADFILFPGWVDAPNIAALMEIADIGLAPGRLLSPPISRISAPSLTKDTPFPIAFSLSKYLPPS